MKNYQTSQEVLLETNSVETPLGIVTCKTDTGNLKLQEEIENFLKMLKKKYN